MIPARAAVSVRCAAAAVAVGAVLFTLLPGAAGAATTVRIWHSLRGPDAEVFASLLERYNASQEEVRVAAEYKGGETDTVLAAARALRARQPLPDLLQVADDYSTTVLAVKGLARPLAEAVAPADVKFLVPEMLAFTRGARGEQYGFPLEVAVPMFFYNQDLLRGAGIDPPLPAPTWRGLQAQLLALRQPGSPVSCAYTSSNQAWIHVENLGAWHGENIASKNNGNDGAGAALSFNGLLHVRHVALMMSWLKSQLFTYSGRAREGDARFASGECATLSAGSTALASLIDGGAAPRLAFGVAPMPFHEEGARQPVASLAGGSALWLMAGRKPAENRAVGQFLRWFASAPVASEWHQKTGSLPLTEAAWRATQESGYYERVPGLGPLLQTVIEQRAGAVKRVRAVRLPNYERVREVIDAQLEAVWNGSKPAKQGLDDAVRLGNLAMRDQAAAAGAAPAVAGPAARAPAGKAPVNKLRATKVRY